MNVGRLPDGYRLIGKIELSDDLPTARKIAILSVAIAVVSFCVGLALVPFRRTFSVEAGVGILLRRIVCTIGLILAYLVLHEGVHGLFIRILGKVKPTFGVSGAYLYAGTDRAWFDRMSYLVIALAPVVVWTIVLTIGLAMASSQWFWALYLVQVVNLSGSAGDLFLAGTVLRMPPDVLVQDTGVSMSFFSRM
ncbi:MAG: DUF3267 domain-containing protein [Sphaerochaetaceae bacterium]|jgi:hypothetical protein